MSTRCVACPVPAGSPCLGATRPVYCEWAASGGPVKLAHVVRRSAIAEGPAPAFPTLLEQAKNLAGAVVAAVASGGKLASPEERQRRLAICGACEHFTGKRCRKCTCVMRWKVKLDAWHCPIEKF